MFLQGNTQSNAIHTVGLKAGARVFQENREQIFVISSGYISLLRRDGRAV